MNKGELDKSHQTKAKWWRLTPQTGQQVWGRGQGPREPVSGPPTSQALWALPAAWLGWSKVASSSWTQNQQAPGHHPSPSPGKPHSSGETIRNCSLDRRQDWLRRMVGKEPCTHGPAMRRHRGRRERETQEPRGPSQVRSGGWGHRAGRKCIRMRILSGIHEQDTALL